MAAPDVATVRVCPNCGYSHLRASRPHSPLEQAQAWWTSHGWFRCQTCNWRGRLRDVWDPDAAFPNLPPLRLGRDLNIEILQRRDEQSLIELLLSRKEDIGATLRVWLDDSRPAPGGWVPLTSVTSAQRLLEAGLVSEISLDHDLGWCADCLDRGEHLKHSGHRHCPHTPTGFDLVVWMSDTGHWPKHPPVVHSGNIEGGARMLGVIAKRWQDLAPGTERPAVASPAAHSAVDSSTVSALTTCPRCGGAHLYRTHRRSNFERFRSMITRRYPIRCEACGWTRWSNDPILVRITPSAETPTERIESALIEQIDPD